MHLLSKAIAKSKDLKIQLILIVLVLLLIFLSIQSKFDWAKIWTDFFDPVSGLAALLIATYIWFNNIRENYKNELPKRLSVLFKVNGHPIYYCHEAFLSGEADIRQMAQQVGLQENLNRTNNRKEYLGFTHFYRIIDTKPKVDNTSNIENSGDKKIIMAYLLEIHLTGEYHGIEATFKEAGKDILQDTYIKLAKNGGRSVLHTWKTELNDHEGISLPLKKEIAGALNDLIVDVAK